MPLLLLLSSDASLHHALDTIVEGHFPGLTLLRFESYPEIEACLQTLGAPSALGIDVRDSARPPGKPIAPTFLIVVDPAQAPDDLPALSLPLRPAETRSILRLLLRPSDSASENLQSQGRKFEAIARFQSGLAHDLNNRLTTLLGNLEFLPGLLPDENEMFVDMRNAAEGAVHLIRQIQTFSHRDPLPPHSFSLCELLRESLDLARRLCGKACDLEFMLPDAALPVHSDEALLEQVLFSWLAVCAGNHPRLLVEVFPENDRTGLRLSVPAGQVLLPPHASDLPEISNSRDILRQQEVSFHETAERFELWLPNALVEH
jgi:signal transduction histidine kinase